MKGTHRYYILAFEDARQKRPIKHEYGGTTVLTDGAEALGRAEVLAEEYPALGAFEEAPTSSVAHLGTALAVVLRGRTRWEVEEHCRQIIRS
jgi:hypothetical protein